MKNKKITVNVSIPAYNSEKTIEKLIRSILIQKRINYKLESVVVHSDSSSDNTVKTVRNFKNNLVSVIAAKKRSGYSSSLIKLIKRNKADLLLQLNDDVIINDSHFIEKLIKPFFANKNLGLVCGNIQPLKPTSYVGKAAQSGYIAFKNLGEKINHGSNAFTCDGKSLCFSNTFASSIKFPINHKDMGNSDGFIYLTCIKNGFDYAYAKYAILYFKLPTTLKDFTKWQVRSYKSNKYVLKNYFGDLAEKEFKIPKLLFNYYKAIEFIKHPISSILIQFIGFYCTYKAAKEKNEFNLKWDLVQSTRDL